MNSIILGFLLRMFTGMFSQIGHIHVFLLSSAFYLNNALICTRSVNPLLQKSDRKQIGVLNLRSFMGEEFIYIYMLYNFYVVSECVLCTCGFRGWGRTPPSTPQIFRVRKKFHIKDD